MTQITFKLDDGVQKLHTQNKRVKLIFQLSNEAQQHISGSPKQTREKN